jgi:hypothetical protein
MRWAVSLRNVLLTMCLALGTAAGVCAQEPAAAPTASSGARPARSVPGQRAAEMKAHRFWDAKNNWLFAGVGASRALDYFSTQNMRRRGRHEILLTDEVVDNHAAFAIIEAAGAGVSIGAAYLFHRTGHHRLERWTSIVHIGFATGGGIRNYSLKSAHVAPAPPAP